MKIGATYLNIELNRTFKVEDIQVDLTSSGAMKVRIFIRWLDGFYQGKTTFFVATADNLKNMDYIEG